jgi:hypothetical protein
MPRRYDDEDDRDDDDAFDIGRRGRRRDRASSAAARLKGPAIGLIVVIALHLLAACLATPIYGLAIAGVGPPELKNGQGGDNPIFGLAFCLLSLVVQAFMMFGAVQMLRGRMYGVSMATAVLSVIPCCGSSCYVFGIPFGVWALVVLNDPDVKNSFVS